MALPSASEVPTTSPSHESTSGGHMESYGAYQRKRYVLAHPGVHLPAGASWHVGLAEPQGVVQAWVVQNVTFPRYCSGMGLGDSPCTLLVSPWLGEVVGASLAMG